MFLKNPLKVPDPLQGRIVFHLRGGEFHLSTAPPGALRGLEADCPSKPLELALDFPLQEREGLERVWRDFTVCVNGEGHQSADRE